MVDTVNAPYGSSTRILARTTSNEGLVVTSVAHRCSMADPSWRSDREVMKLNRFQLVALPLWLALVCSILGVVIAYVSDLIVQQVL